MSYQNPILAEALGWKYNHAQGICTSDGVLTAWPVSLGAQPNDAALTSVVAEYQAHLDSEAYVEARQADYIARMGGGDAFKAMGFNIDAIWQVLIDNNLAPAPNAAAQRGSPEKILDDRAKVKAAHPKP